MASIAVFYLSSRPRSLLRQSAPCSLSPPCHLLSSTFSSSSSSSSSSSFPDPKNENARNDAGSSDFFSSLKSHLKQAERTPSHQSPGNGEAKNAENSQTNPRSSFSFSLLKDHLKQIERNPSQPPPRKPFSFSQGAGLAVNKPSAASLDDIRKSLSRFSQRSAAPGPPSPQDQPIMFQQLYKKAFTENAAKGGFASGANPARDSIASLKDHLARFKPLPRKGSKIAIPISELKETVSHKPGAGEAIAAGNRPIGGGSVNLPLNVFGKELKEDEKKKAGESAKVEPENMLLKDYTMEELGEKLQKLRPEGVKQGENWFSLSELNERLMKLKAIEKEEDVRGSGFSFGELRKTIQTISMSESEKSKRKEHQSLDMLSRLSGTPSYMKAPPKEHLVEKYFHPDNMSSAEKLKLELKRVRDEFKMSETDCGSTRVQIAQLTTEIHHLSKVLRKKDKHSRKGLQAKVQMRKKLLKYLRRTDWDSYCFILSKLGLRDNPGYKQ